MNSLLQAILENPADDFARLVYADWLEQQGDEPRAEFIRVQCAIADLDHELMSEEDCEHGSCPGCVERRGLRRRERGLIHDERINLWQAFVPWVPKDWTMTLYAREIAFRVGIREGVQDVKHILRRGFVAEVHCTLADWYGRECVEPSDWPTGSPTGSPTGVHSPICSTCHGTGRIGGNGPAIVAAQPIERVEVTDAVIHQSGGNDTFYVGGLGVFPPEYWKSLDGLPSRLAARAALSAASIRWAKGVKS